MTPAPGPRKATLRLQQHGNHTQEEEDGKEEEDAASKEA